MNWATTDDADGRARKGLRASLRTGAVTAAVFAAGALLALVLVGPHFESSATVSSEDGTRLPLSQAQALVRAAVFEAAAAADVNGRGEGPRELPTLRQALLAFLNGPETGGQFAENASLRSSTVEEREDGAGFVLTVRTSTPADANRLAETASSLLAERLSELDAPVAAEDRAELQLARERLAELEREAATDLVEGTEAVSIDARRGALQSDERELAERIESSGRRLARLQALEVDASAEIPSDTTELPGLDAPLERYRALRARVGELATTLPAESPRLRIVRQRLDELAGEVQSGAAALRAAELDDRRELDQRLAAVASEIGALDGSASERQGRSERAARLAQAEARVNALEAAVARPRAAAVVGTIEGPRTIRQPFLAAGLLAALAGFALGAATSLAMRSANRDRGFAPVADASKPAETDKGEPASHNGPSTAVDTGGPREVPEAITLDEAVAALSASRISRSLVVAVSDADHPSTSLRLSRALAADGQLVLLIDLSPSQRAAREAGVPNSASGFRDVVAGSLGLSSVTFNDEDGSIDIVAAGQGSGAPSAWTEALGFARRAYDQVIVDCGTSAARDLLALADENAAVLVDEQGLPTEKLTARLTEFELAGLDTAILRV